MTSKMNLSAFALAMVSSLAAMSGCSNKPAPVEAGKTAQADDKEVKIAAALAELSNEDRREAEAQRFCVVSNMRLGSMDKPYKIKIEGEPVFLCCDGCKEEALKDPKATLAKVVELKKTNATSK